MSKNDYNQRRKQREADKARKKRDKAERRRRNKLDAESGTPVASKEELESELMWGDDADEDLLGAPRASRGKGKRAGPPAKLFVGGLSWDTTNETLEAFFKKAGEVVEAIVIKDRETGRSRGFGFVTMTDKKTAQHAMVELDGEELDGRRIRVNEATERR